MTKCRWSSLRRFVVVSLAVAGWISALTSEGWRVLPTGLISSRDGCERSASTVTERPVKVYADEPSIDGVRLGDSESRVRQLWGEPERTVADMTADLASNAERGHRYLRYPGGRMAVLHDGRVVVVDGQELTSGSAHSVPAEQVRSEQEKTGALVFTRLSGDAYARLEYSIKDGRIMLVSLSPTTFD